MAEESSGSGKVEEPQGGIKIYLGTAAQDKPQGSRDLEVNIAELNPTNERSHATTQKVEAQVNDGSNAAPVSGTASSSIKATWMGETNRAFPPDVREGEGVRVYEYGNSHQYFWESMGRDDGKRKLERVRWCANDTTANDGELNDSNIYAIEMDTRGEDGQHYQTIRIWTSQGNGEKHSYMFMMDAQNSQVTLSDEAGNMLQLDTEEHSWLVRNQDESFIQLNKKDISICCHGNIIMSTDAGKMVLSAKGDMTQVTSGSCSISAQSNLSLNAGAALSMGFGSSGTCSGGGAMNFSVQRMNIN